MKNPAKFLVGGAAAVAMLAGVASARMLAEPYVVINAGAAFPPDQEISGNFGDDTAGNLTGFGGEFAFDPGFFGSVVLGSKGRGFGLELEGFYNAVNFDTNVAFDDDVERFFGGDGSVYGGLVNLVYTFSDSYDDRWRPRVGAGVGYSRITFDLDNAFKDSDGAIAYQGFAGVGYALNERTEIQTNVRYLGFSNVDFNDNDFAADAQLDEIVGTIGVVFRW